MILLISPITFKGITNTINVSSKQVLQKDTYTSPLLFTPIFGDTFTLTPKKGKPSVYSSIKKISSDEEYFDLLKCLKKDKNFRKDWLYDDAIACGIMPYSGRADISKEINKYLRTGIFVEQIAGINSKDVLEDYIKCFDYALKMTDEKFGKYKGFVCRYGQFDENQKQYTSASSKAECAIRHSNCTSPDKKYPFNIIYTNNGHKIKDVHRAVGSDFADAEEEVILSPDTKYVRIEDLTPELKEIKEDFMRIYKSGNKSETSTVVNSEDLKLYFWNELL